MSGAPPTGGAVVLQVHHLEGTAECWSAALRCVPWSAPGVSRASGSVAMRPLEQGRPG